MSVDIEVEVCDTAEPKIAIIFIRDGGENLCDAALDRNELARLIQQATEALSKMDVPTIGESEKR